MNRFALLRAVPVLAALLSVASVQSALALSIDQARENCRPKMAPMVIACMQAMTSGDRETRLAKCRGSSAVYAAMKSCVMAALNASNGRSNVAIDINNGKKEAPVDIGNALPAGFVPPPRTITDITAILDAEKPDPSVLAKLKADADADPGKKSGDDLAQFLYARGNARSLLGRNAEAVADGEQSLAVAKKSSDEMFVHRAEQFIALQRQAVGDLKGSIAMFEQINRETNTPKMKAWQIDSNRFLLYAVLQTGDVSKAQGLLNQITSILTEARTSGHPAWRDAYKRKGRLWEGDYETAHGALLEARGNYRDAETAFTRASQFWTAAIPDLDKSDYSSPPSQIRQASDGDLLNAARVKARQGRFAEAEVDVRRALISRLKDQGKYNPLTTRYVMGLATILGEEGRYEESEKLIRTSLEIQRTLGIGDNTPGNASVLSQLGTVLIYQRKQAEAAEVFAQLDKAIANWEPARREAMQSNGSRISALLGSGQIKEGVAAAETLVKRIVARIGENQFDSGAAHGTLAVAYMKAGRNDDAIREFRTAIPVLMAGAHENSDDDSGSVAGRADRLQFVTENYIALLAKNSADNNVAQETFALADSIRGQSVQNALSASSARNAVKDPALAELVRNEQDLSKQLNAGLGALNNALSSNVRDDNVIKATNAAIDKLRSDRDKARAAINAKFPAYADLVSPKPPSVEKIRATLADGEAMLSFYFGHDASFVWAVPKNGEVAFAAIPVTGGELDAKVRKLRQALEPDAATISDIPAFDVDLGYELYSLLLKPVEAGWKQSKSLVVVTNGALGLLPLSLLPTAPSQIRKDDTPLFASYRDVPWLARTHAVTMVPSSSALVTLRQTPAGAASRKEIVAFGDPYFSKDEADEAAQQVQVAALDTPPPLAQASAEPQAAVMRGMPLKRRSAPKLDGIDSADLAMLPRLPDTADELKSIALALKADPTEVLNLGKEANEQKVKTMDLSGFKIIAFATHGLTAGELNGLTQPALALSAPDVSGTPGDGLLTMEEILALKLDADWVILSACNTGAGDGAGAEAASGLGRAFFYAGTRALLVTNWSVHSQSARELVTDLFKRQADDVTITRAEALRQAMMALADGPGYTDDQGKTEFAYAHPLFWAPYSIIGDGGHR